MSLPETAIETQTSVYRYYDASGVLLYVGITGRADQRNTEHNKTKSWWHRVAHQSIEHFPSRAEAHAREVELIQRYMPPFNTQHNPQAATMQSAYQELRELEQSRAITDPNEIARHLNRDLPVQVLRVDPVSGYVDMVSKIEHLPLVSRIVFTPGAQVYQGRSIGFLQAIEHRGPFAAFRLRLKREAKFTAGVVKVRRNDPKGQTYRVAGVWVSDE